MQNYKNKLQEFCQKNGMALPMYFSIHEGEPHMPKWKSRVYISNNFTITSGFHWTKKEAEQEAAKIVYDVLMEEKQETVTNETKVNAKTDNTTVIRNPQSISSIDKNISTTIREREDNVVYDKSNVECNKIDKITLNSDRSHIISESKTNTMQDFVKEFEDNIKSVKNNSTNIPAQANSTNIPAQANSTNIPAQANSTNIPAQANRSSTTLLQDAQEVQNSSNEILDLSRLNIEWEAKTVGNTVILIDLENMQPNITKLSSSIKKIYFFMSVFSTVDSSKFSPYGEVIKIDSGINDAADHLMSYFAGKIISSMDKSTFIIIGSRDRSSAVLVTLLRNEGFLVEHHTKVQTLEKVLR